MAVYEPLQRDIVTHDQDGSNVIGNDRLDRSDDTTTAFLPPKSFISGKRSRRHQSWVYCRGTLIMCFLVLLPLLLYSPAVASDSIGAGRQPIDICSPDLKFPSFFEPDMLMGNFTLGQAKAIDLGWNTVIGRGGQALMAWGSYGIVMQGLTRIAEVTPVRYDLFAALVFHPTSVASTLSLAQSVPQLKGWRPKFALGWLVYSLALTVTIATLFDVSSGYARSSGLIYYPGDSINGTYYGPFETLPSVFEYGRNQKDSLRYNCLPDLSYQWGFVSGWIFVIFPLWSIWVFGMYVLWVDAQHNSALCRKGWRGGEWRAIIDLSHAIDQELGPNLTGYSNSELGKCLERCAPVMYDVQEDDNGTHRVRLTPQHPTASAGRLK